MRVCVCVWEGEISAARYAAGPSPGPEPLDSSSRPPPSRRPRQDLSSTWRPDPDRRPNASRSSAFDYASRPCALTRGPTLDYAHEITRRRLEGPLCRGRVHDS